MYDYLRGVRIFHTIGCTIFYLIGCTIFFKVLQGVRLFEWVYDFILAKSAGCTFIRGCTIIGDLIVSGEVSWPNHSKPKILTTKLTAHQQTESDHFQHVQFGYYENFEPWHAIPSIYCQN